MSHMDIHAPYGRVRWWILISQMKIHLPNELPSLGRMPQMDIPMVSTDVMDIQKNVHILQGDIAILQVSLLAILRLSSPQKTASGTLVVRFGSANLLGRHARSNEHLCNRGHENQKFRHIDG